MISEIRQHFEEHGWVRLEGVLDAKKINAYKSTLDRIASGIWSLTGNDVTTTRIDTLILRDDSFIEFIKIPRILEAYTEIGGIAATLKNSWAFIKRPADFRHNAEEVQKYRQDMSYKKGWHRGSAPKWGMYEDECHPGMHHFPYLNFFVFLTDVGPGDGGTWAMDKSHKVHGDYAEVSKFCEPIEATCRAGDAFLFTESLMHSAPHILTENTRYSMTYTFIPPFYCNMRHYEVPEWFFQNIRNDDLRGVLGEWRGKLDQCYREPYTYNFEDV